VRSQKENPKLQERRKMKRILLVCLLVASVCLAQEPPTDSQLSSVQDSRQQQQPAAPSSAQQQTIVVPAGTRVPVKLTYSLWSKTAHVGDTVHAVTVFPVTVGATVAIPAGTYVEGVIDKVWRRASTNHPAIELHFTQLLFANGYTVPLESATTDVLEKLPKPPLAAPSSESARDEEDASGAPAQSLGMFASGFAAQSPQQPTLTPPPNPGPSKGAVIGASLAGTAALIITLAVVSHHHPGGYTMLDAGSQVDLLLQSPLELDAQQVAAALATPNAQ
jgi:hypothetical protein